MPIATSRTDFDAGKCFSMCGVAEAQTVYAHGIAADAYFDSTLGFDDSRVADGAIPSLYNQLNFSDTGQ